MRAESDVLESCVRRLKELGYLDDRRYARSYANHRIGSRPVGRSRLARELAAKSVDRGVIQEALDQVFEDNDEEALIDRAIEKRTLGRKAPGAQQDLKRLFDYLMRSGFEYDLIMRKIRKLRTSVHDQDNE